MTRRVAVRQFTAHTKGNTAKHGPCSIDGCGAPIHNLKTGWCRNCYARFLHSGTPHRQVAPPGTGTVMNTGYRRVGNGGEKVMEHRLIAERALGRPLPAGAVVHHADGDRANNANSNLVICPSDEYHYLLHQRMRAMDACGHADWRKCTICKAYSPPDEVRRHVHAACERRRRQEARVLRFTARAAISRAATR